MSERSSRLVGAATITVALVFLVGLIRLSKDAEGTTAANLLIGAPILASALAYVLLRRMRASEEAREWSALLLTTAIVYGILASFSVREGNLAVTYLVQTGFTVGIFALLALGLSVQMGYAGLLNFGHVAFMGVGAYVVALWTTRYAEGWAPRLVGGGAGPITLALLAAALAGLVVYVPAVVLLQRLRQIPHRVQIGIASALALVVAMVALVTMLPLDERGAVAMVVLLGVLVALVVAALAGLLLGAASLRLREDYLAIVTLGSAEIFRTWATNARDFTNGSLGISLRTASDHMPITSWARGQEGLRQFVRDLGMGGNYALFTNSIIVALVVALAFLLLWTLARSPWGRVLTAIREDEDVAAALGKNTLLSKLQAIMIGSALAALAGVLFMWNKTNVYPTDYLPIVTFYTIAILVIGGIGNHKGALLGAVILWGIFEFAGNMNNAFRQPCLAGETNWFTSIFCDFAGPKQQLLVGLVLILVIVFRPEGAVGNREELSYAK